MSIYRDADRLQRMMWYTLKRYRDNAPNRYLRNSDPMSWKLVVKDIKSIGECHDWRREIVLQKWLVEHSSPEQILDTLYHEIAHAIIGTEYSARGRAMSHGRAWKAMAAHLGATPKATVHYDILNEGVAEEHQKKIEKAPPKWVVVIKHANDELEKIGACRKRLQSLEERIAKGRPDTEGKLWLIDRNDWEALESGEKMFSKRMLTR